MYQVSVIMSIYNCASTLAEALDSLFNQSYKNFNIIICDDGSQDDSYKIASRYASENDNIILIKNKKNMGLNFSLNHCLEYVDAEFIARMDGDDISLPTRFEIEVNFLKEHPEYAVVSSPCTYFDENGIWGRGKGQGRIVRKHFIHGSPITHASCMARTEAFRAVGGYTVSSKRIRVEDYDLWFKLFAAGYNLYHMQESLYLMRDDRNAALRRNWKNRYNEFLVKIDGFKLLGIPWYYYIFTLEPIIKYFVPLSIYRFFHKIKNKK